MNAVIENASPEGLAFLVDVHARLGVPALRALSVGHWYLWQLRRDLSRWERTVATALGLVGCDGCDRWVDPDTNPVTVHYDSNHDPDVQVCQECCVASERAALEAEGDWYPTDAQMREDDDLVADAR